MLQDQVFLTQIKDKKNLYNETYSIKTAFV